MAKRKTVDLPRLVSEVNRRNQMSTCPADIRQGWNSLVEWALHNAGRYNGFGYFGVNDLEPGITPGILQDEHGTATFPDETRRYYYF